MHTTPEFVGFAFSIARNLRFVEHSFQIGLDPSAFLALYIYCPIYGCKHGELINSLTDIHRFSFLKELSLSQSRPKRGTWASLWPVYTLGASCHLLIDLNAAPKIYREFLSRANLNCIYQLPDECLVPVANFAGCLFHDDCDICYVLNCMGVTLPLFFDVGLPFFQFSRLDHNFSQLRSICYLFVRILLPALWSDHSAHSVAA